MVFGDDVVIEEWYDGEFWVEYECVGFCKECGKLCELWLVDDIELCVGGGDG